MGSAELLDDVIRRCLEPQRDGRPGAADAARELGEGGAASGAAVPVPGEFDIGDVIEGRFEVIRTLGSGATAVTYLVDDRVIGSRFVVKALRNPRLAPLAVNEFRMLADVSHPSLVGVFEVYPGEGFVPFEARVRRGAVSSRSSWPIHLESRGYCQRWCADRRCAGLPSRPRLEPHASGRIPREHPRPGGRCSAGQTDRFRIRNA